jgi:hypothetical protein
MADQRNPQGRGRPMPSDDGRRWRALRAWFDDFPPDDQERLLGYLEHLMTLAQRGDMGAFMAMVDQVFALIEREEMGFDQAAGERDPDDR